MRTFTPIDLEQWNRAELYHHYTEVWPACLVALNVTLDVTKFVPYLKENHKKFAPAIYYLSIKALMEQQNFRMGIVNKVLGEWNELKPFYPFLNEDNNMTFHTIDWCEDFDLFEQSYIEDAEKNKACKKAICGEIPPNFVLMSITSNTIFESCTFSLKYAKEYFSPALFFSKYYEENGRLKMRLSFTFNHAVADGYHVQVFFDRLQELFDDPSQWRGK